MVRKQLNLPKSRKKKKLKISKRQIATLRRKMKSKFRTLYKADGIHLVETAPQIRTILIDNDDNGYFKAQEHVLAFPYIIWGKVALDEYSSVLFVGFRNSKMPKLNGPYETDEHKVFLVPLSNIECSGYVCLSDDINFPADAPIEDLISHFWASVFEGDWNEYETLSRSSLEDMEEWERKSKLKNALKCITKVKWGSKEIKPLQTLRRWKRNGCYSAR